MRDVSRRGGPEGKKKSNIHSREEQRPEGGKKRNGNISPARISKNPTGRGGERERERQGDKRKRARSQKGERSNRGTRTFKKKLILSGESPEKKGWVALIKTGKKKKKSPQTERG